MKMWFGGRGGDDGNGVVEGGGREWDGMKWKVWMGEVHRKGALGG